MTVLPDVNEEEMLELYAWVDGIPLSKPKKSLARDFADGVCVAEIVHHYFPRLVQLHNYSPASSSTKKVYNWNTLNQRVFRKLGFQLPKESIEAAALAEPGAAERVLKLLRTKLAQYQAKSTAAAAKMNDDGATARPESSEGLICSYPGTGAAAAAGVAAEEVEELRALNQILEFKAAKLEQLLRLKEAKIAALTARLQGAGLLSPQRPTSQAY